jgi:hypothetical protein
MVDLMYADAACVADWKHPDDLFFLHGSSSLFLARPRFAQAWLQYFLGFPYSRLARNSPPQTGQITFLVDFQFSGCGCLR